MEPFGIATSVLQVADTGFSLAKDLYQYAQDIKNAKPEVHNIAKEIDITSDVLRNFGNILKDEHAKALCSHQLQVDALRALDECRATFDYLDKTLKSFYKADRAGGITIKARLRWPIEKGKTKAHQERLERLKSSLSLMLEIIRYAKDTKSFISPEHQALHADRHHIESLIRSNEDLVRSITSNNASYHDSIAGHEDVGSALHHYLQGLQIPASHGQPSNQVSLDSPAVDTAEDPISKRLRACIDAAVRVTQSLNTALAEWLASRTVPKESFQDALQNLCLQAFDLETLMPSTKAHGGSLAQVPMCNPQQLHPPIARPPTPPTHPLGYKKVALCNFVPSEIIYEDLAWYNGSDSALVEPSIEKSDGRSLLKSRQIQPHEAAHRTRNPKSRGRRGGRLEKVEDGAKARFTTTTPTRPQLLPPEPPQTHASYLEASSTEIHSQDTACSATLATSCSAEHTNTNKSQEQSSIHAPSHEQLEPQIRVTMEVGDRGSLHRQSQAWLSEFYESSRRWTPRRHDLPVTPQSHVGDYYDPKGSVSINYGDHTEPGPNVPLHRTGSQAVSIASFTAALNSPHTRYVSDSAYASIATPGDYSTFVPCNGPECSSDLVYNSYTIASGRPASPSPVANHTVLSTPSSNTRAPAANEFMQRPCRLHVPYSAGLSQGRSTSNIENAYTPSPPILESSRTEFRTEDTRPTKKRKLSNDEDVREYVRQSSRKRFLSNQAGQKDREDYESTGHFDAARSLEVLWNRWTNLSSDVLKRPTAVAESQPL